MDDGQLSRSAPGRWSPRVQALTRAVRSCPRTVCGEHLASPQVWTKNARPPHPPPPPSSRRAGLAETPSLASSPGRRQGQRWEGNAPVLWIPVSRRGERHPPLWGLRCSSAPCWLWAAPQPLSLSLHPANHPDFCWPWTEPSGENSRK